MAFRHNRDNGGLFKLDGKVSKAMDHKKANDTRHRVEKMHIKLKPLLEEKYDSLILYEETDPKKLAHFDYKYIISNGAFSHTAFRTKEGLDRWLEDAGVKIGKEISHLNHSRSITGKYTVISMAGDAKSLEAFAKRHNLRASKILDNGRFTRAYIKKGRHGNTIYYLNPNYPREELPYIHE